MTPFARDVRLVTPKRRPQARLRLVALPYAGAGAAAFHSWAEFLPPEIELCAVEPPGRGLRLRERPFTRLIELVVQVAETLRPHLDRPFALFGHSMGGLVAFELVRELARAGAALPLHVFVSAAAAPHTVRSERLLHDLPDDELADELRRMGGTPPAILDNRELLTLVLPAVRADLEAVETYVASPGPPIDCDLTAFAGLRDRLVAHRTMLAWGGCTRGRFELALVAGDHFFLGQPAFRWMLLERLERLTAVPGAGATAVRSAS